MSANGIGLNGNTRLIWILVLASLATGGAGFYNSTDDTVETRNREDIDKLAVRVEKLIDSQDEVLQREMRLLTAPIDLRALENSEKINNLRDRINDLEVIVAALEERTK